MAFREVVSQNKSGPRILPSRALAMAREVSTPEEPELREM
jgi:hypothetical protein